MIDTPEKAYWAGYASLAGHVDDDVLTVVSKERFHLDSLLSILPDGNLSMFEVETGHRKNAAYYTFTHEPGDVLEWHRPVRKLASHSIRGMLDARPVACWDLNSIDVDLPTSHAEFVMEFMPYLRIEHLTESKTRLYTCTAYDTKRSLEYLYRYAPVARESRKVLYDGLERERKKAQAVQ